MPQLAGRASIGQIAGMQLRHDWTVEEAEALIARPFHDLLADGSDPTARLNALGSLALARVQCGDTEVGHALAHDTMQAFRALRRPMGHSMTTYLSHLAEGLVEACAEHPGETNWIADGTGAIGDRPRRRPAG